MKTSNNFLGLIRKYLPGIGLAFLTIMLMFYFKESKDGFNDFVEKGKVGIVDFYTENLRPIFYSSQLTNEDVFNFAMYQNLPVDKENNKYLTVGQKTDGTDYFQIVPGKELKNSDNYNKFLNGLNITGDEKERIDSIISSYKDQIYTLILSNEDKTFAVSPEITELRKAIITDLINFTETVKAKNSKNTKELAFAKAKLTQPYSYNLDNNEYVLLSPDTIFVTKAEFSKQAIKERIAEINAKESQAAKSKNDKYSFTDKPVKGWNTELGGLEFQIDSLEYAAYLPKQLKSGVLVTDCSAIPGHDSILVFNSDSLSKILEFSIKSASEAARLGSNIAFEVNLQVGKILEQTTQMLINHDFQDWEEFGFKIDSAFQNINSDSLSVDFEKKWDQKNFQQKMEKFGEKMKQLGEKLKKSENMKKEAK